MHEDLKLELSQGKNLITHARTQAASFLGYEITVQHCAMGSVYAATGGSYHLGPVRAGVPGWWGLAAAVVAGVRRQIGAGMSGR